MSSDRLKKIIVILGPTASGKSNLALTLAKKYQGYIISADSRQVYRNMDIGTGKIPGKLEPIPTTLAHDYLPKQVFRSDGILHFMINIANPDESFTVADWQHQVDTIISNLPPNTTYKLPIIVGGTGLYITSLIHRYAIPAVTHDQTLRKKLNHTKLKDLQKQLQIHDLTTYKQIDFQNKQRVVRALEYTLTTQKSFITAQKQNKPIYHSLQIGLQIDRQTLITRINERVHDMVTQGLANEAKTLFNTYPPDLPALATIGYQEWIEYFKQQQTLAATIEKIQIHTRQYAKRQMTWFRRDDTIQWHDCNDLETIDRSIESFLQS